MPKRILHIEDDENWAKLAQQLLLDGGLKPTEFVVKVNLKDGLAHIENAGTDLILLDLGLPDSGTRDTIKHIHDMDAKAPVVVLSGNSALAYRADCMEAGAMRFLSKEHYARNAHHLADACFSARVNWRRIHEPVSI